MIFSGISEPTVVIFCRLSKNDRKMQPWALHDTLMHDGPCTTFYHYLQSRGITCLLDTLKRNVQISEDNVLSLSQLFDWFYLPHFLLLQWVVVKYKGVRSPLAFHIGTHPQRAGRQLSLCPQKAFPPHRRRRCAAPAGLCCSRWSVLLPRPGRVCRCWDRRLPRHALMGAGGPFDKMQHART